MRYLVSDKSKFLVVTSDPFLQAACANLSCSIWCWEDSMLMPEEFQPSIFQRFKEYEEYELFVLHGDRQAAGVLDEMELSYSTI